MKYILFLAFLSITTFGQAQVTFQPREVNFENEGIIYNREFTVDARLHTNGFSIGLNFARIKTYYLTKYYHFDIGDLKHHKEYRQQSYETRYTGGFGGNRSFVLGKQNSFFVMRAGYGQKRYFSEKAKKKGLAVGLSYEAGPSLGLLKPYYLELRYSVNNNVVYSVEKYSPENHDIFLDVFSVNGASGFTKGLSEISVIPGIHAQVAAHFDWGAFDEFVKALEAGIMVDLFIKEVPIMVELENVENTPLFINLFINLQLGKRY